MRNHLKLKIKFTSNYKKHLSTHLLQQLLINNFYHQLLSLCRPLKMNQILDVGCGEGFTLNFICKNKVGKNCIGLDISTEAINLGRKIHPGIKLIKGNICKIPFKNNQFDLVICTEVLEHLPNPLIALKEIHRVTRKYYLLSVPNEPWFQLSNLLRAKNLFRWGNDIEHINHWSKKNFLKIVATKTNKILNVKTPYPWIMVLVEKIG